MRATSAADILRVIKEQLAEKLSRPKYELLIRPLHPLSFDENSQTDPVLRLAISNDVLRGWLMEQYGELIAELATLVVGSPVGLEVEVGSPNRLESSAETPRPAAAADDSNDMIDFPPSSSERGPIRKPLLNPRLTFDSFVVGDSNQFSHSACWQVAQRPGHSYNPLFIYGGVGLGKTHLMHAIGHEAWSRDNSRNVVYVTSEKFTNDFIEHVRTSRMSQFNARYREADVLLIDDIQFLSGKPETQSEFFHTFTDLIEARKQIVISSDRPPRTLKGMEDRLISRFSMGLVCDIGDPSLETRMAILKQKAEMEKVHLPDDVCQFIAERVSSNVRELDGALNRLMAYCDFNKREPDIELAARVLSDFIRTDGLRSQVSMKQIIGHACEYFNVSEHLLLSPNRSKRVALARMIVMYMAREFTNLTLSQIGAELGGRDHSTVSHGANKIAREIVEDPYIEQAVTQISRMLR